MTEREAIRYVEKMDIFERATVYMNYYVNLLHSKYTAEYYEIYGINKWEANTFEIFCDKSNIQEHDSGISDWEERGFASKSWINLRPASIYHYIYHNIK